MYDSHILKIYGDGSALKNPGGPGGLGLIIEFPEHLNKESKKLGRGYYATTNNRMELRALLEAMKFIKNNIDALKVDGAVFITDSTYVYNGATSAIYWNAGGWKSVSGELIDNKDLWKDYLSLKKGVGRNFDIERVSGKSSLVLKEVDRLAKEAAKRPTYNDFGYQPGRVAKSKIDGKNVASKFPARGQSETIHVYGYAPYNKNQNKVKFDLYSETTKTYVAKYYAYIEKGLEIHLHGCYIAQFNSDPDVPIIVTIENVEQVNPSASNE